ncbi:ATP-binding cassette domain-containing protein [Tengunoibacter tsumagoiensis]|uniref:UvrABC system protein A n=1 Tax=Tengunoibacter tsumagoiensis TaxID=2014871 RepID=A0A402A9D6_9CHLR|nr:excinuclease ABC subunit UvrA [Tengunoibacter tsumagoiensis]GCE15561.1 excinuclease ABC subunit A [Tengunoibacter tsumagoiensis]
MVQEYIEIRGARENNLKDVSLRLPKRKIIIFTGVSGSGKSSLVFDTIANEAQRLLFENFSMFVRNFLPRYPQPDADTIENLSMAVIVDQKRLGGGSTSTVGTVTDIASVLRLLFSRIGKPYVGSANAFSFNDPQGMCLECNGLGRKIGITQEAMIDTTRSLNEGAVIAPGLAGWECDLYAQSGFFDNDKKIAEYTPEELDLLLHSELRKHPGLAYNTYEGLVHKFNRKFVARDIQTLSPRIRQKVEPFLKLGPCPLCKGARLNQAALSCKIKGYTIADMVTMEIGDLLEIVKGIEEAEAAPIIRTLTERLQHLVEIGLEYLSLGRATDTLSGGESQRVKMVKHLNGSLVDVMYIFDEPSVGLHPRDVHRLNDLLEKLRDKGNTVLVVEHDPDVIKKADYIVDMGPYAGTEGGTIVYEGDYAGLLQADTLTGNHLLKTRPMKESVRHATGSLPIVHATVNNLQDVSVNIPTGVLTVITGVAGSGKSSLIHKAFLSQHPEAVVIDQSSLSTSSRSNPATYTGIMDDVRKAFATANKADAGLFSFNSKGACPNCQGLGVTYTDLGFLEGVKLPCDVCSGKRFKDEVLLYTLNGKSIADVLNMTISQALAFLKMKEVQPKLQALSDVGLDYLTLGQPLSTLSGGECQRIKLASELHKRGSIYVMDEPTTGLHLSDIGRLLTIMNRLVDGGNTVVVIEHHLDIIRNADWIIDMGPEGGHNGGTILFEGTPSDLRNAKQSLTSQYL